MDAAAFVTKWKRSTRSERSAAQEYFLDLCRVVGHPSPGDFDPTGKDFTLEFKLTKSSGGRGFADAFKRGFFAWESKKRGGDLVAAFNQLLQYSGDLGNPPLLIVSDMDRIQIRTHFTGYPTVLREITLATFDTPKNQKLLKQVFFEPDALRPGETRQEITDKAAKRFAQIADSFRRRQKELPESERTDATRFAHFLDRMVFCMFAEDAGLLPEKIFTRIFERINRDPRKITADVANLFAAMASGGSFWGEDIRHFNGSLFDESPALELEPTDFGAIKEACTFDWSQMDPSIFGTLFERVMDEDQRSRLGAHYTGYDDISTLIEPVVMTPLRRDWSETRERVASLLPDQIDAGAGPGLFPGTSDPSRKSEAQALVDGFLARLRAVRVLDPACGSGNFLYVTLRKLKDLEKEVLIESRHRGLAEFDLKVGPQQLFGIEKNPYAYDLAQMTVWIGHLQWNRDNGFALDRDPVLQPLDTIQNKDAILDLTNPDFPAEPTWPDADFIVGNPPFLGDKKMRGELGDTYVSALRSRYGDRIPGQSDLCCYWFEKARQQIEAGKCARAGLLATQGIRGGASRKVLERIKSTGDIFFAEGDKPWILDGANVHISIIGFDGAAEKSRILDGKIVTAIHSNISLATDIGTAKRLRNNEGMGFIGVSMHGPFDLLLAEAIHMLVDSPNSDRSVNSDVVRPILNAKEITSRADSRWVIYFENDISLSEACLYERPFEFVKRVVKQVRDKNNRKVYRERWWVQGEPRPAMIKATVNSDRILVTPRVSKHRIFVWVSPEVIPSDATVAFARSDDYFFGVLHSRLHEVWARAQGTQVRERESGFRYTPTTCFETFAFPEPTPPQHAAISSAAKRLNELRENWLNPPEWMRTEVLEFPGSVDGPWARYVHEPDERGIGTVRYPRLVAKDSHAPSIKGRTLTALYNERPTWLEQAHRALDEAVFAAYGWKPSMTDVEILAALLELNLQRAGESVEAVDEGDPEVDLDDES